MPTRSVDVDVQLGSPAEGATAMMGGVAEAVRAASIEQWGPARAVELIGQHPAFLEVQAKLQKIAPYDEPVLITGESGSGKELLAQAVYLLGPRRGRPFVSVNCPQYQDGNLTVSELFGHRKGSFTGAISDRKGCFETGDGGVVFLDEIADLHMSAQVMLLRALATGEFQALGSDRQTRVNIRVAAATNRPLDQLTLAHAFRPELYYRLRYFLITVPPLRARGDDWRLLLDHALARLHQKYGVEKRFSAESLAFLEQYHWPGNVRQLNSIATMGYALAEGHLIQPKDFSEQLEVGGGTSADSAEDLYQRVAGRGESFWAAVYDSFMDRELNRAQVRALIRKGLADARGSYRELLGKLHLPQEDYQRFMDFLRHHRLKP